MKQEIFERARRESWNEFEAMLGVLERRKGGDLARFPSLYRGICQDLALARERAFAASLVDRLNGLALRGHEHLYGARRQPIGKAVGALLGEFPRALHRHLGALLFVTALFAALALCTGWLAYRERDLIYGFLDPEQVRQFETMYGPSGMGDEASSVPARVQMFGFYIWNNVSIVFRSFASGLLLGVGSLFLIAYNGAFLGALSGHLTRLGHADNLARWVIAHGAFEIPSLLIAAAAGTALGSAWLAPGNRTRLGALRERGRSVLPLVCGAALMCVIAAGIEAFWSPLSGSAALEYGVGAALWVAVIGGLGGLIAGARRAS